MDWLVDWLMDWLTYWLNHYLYVWLIDWFLSGDKGDELEAMKQEILREMRKEINKAKLEIIEGSSRILKEL